MMLAWRSLGLALLLTLGVAPGAAAQETSLYVVDIGPNRGPPWQVIRYDENGGNPEVFITQQLNRPQDIVFLEAEGEALVSNLFGNNITRYDAQTGDFIDVFAAGIGQPTRMEFGPEGLLYVIQWAGNGRVLRYQRDGSFVDEFTRVGVSNGIGMDWDDQGNLYVSSFDQGVVRRFDVDGNDLGLFVATNLQGPTNIWFDGAGDLLVMDWSGGAIRRYGPQGNFKQTITFNVSEPEGVEFLDDGDFLVGNGGTSSVRRFTSAGARVGDFVPPGSGGLAKPNALRFRTPPGFAINAGLNDAWFNRATAGQGFFIIVFPDRKQVFLAWFTYDTQRPGAGVTATLGEPGHRWLTAQGPFEGDTATLDVVLTGSGVFDAADPPATNLDVEHGSIVITWADCGNATLRYEIPSLGLAGDIPITRIANDNVALCEALQLSKS